MLKKFNLKVRMLVSICTVVFIAFSVTIAVVSVKTSNKVKSDAFLLAEEIAYRYSAVVQGKLEVPMDTARAMAQTFEGMKQAGTPQRKMMDRIQKQILERNPEFLGVWTCWEANALDGKDAEFANTKGHDGSGRYIPYWYRAANKIDMEPLRGYDVQGDGNYYLMAKNSGKETILDPYTYEVDGKEVLITSIVAPIKVDGKILGVAGIDIALSYLVDLVGKIKPFETGYGYIVSNNGTLTAHHKKEILGKDFIERQRPDLQRPIADAIKNGKKYSMFKVAKATGIHSFQVMTPIEIGQTGTPWSFIVSIPTAKALAEAHETMYMSIAIGVVFLLLLILVIYFIAKRIADSMNRVVAGLNDGAEQVASAAGQVSSSSQSLAEGSSEQAAAIEETSSSLEEMSSMTRQNADSARQADALMKEANKVVVQANDSMGKLMNSMDEISKASEETSKIIKTIDEIAFQTNLLALNAAVEAARAGEAGAGFAVVADEVRNLAMRAADAARNTAELIEGTVKKIGDGTNLVTSTNDAFGKVAESASKVGELVAEIAAASTEQAQGIGQVNTAVTEMDKVTQQNAATAEESASASEEMSAQAEQMKGFVSDLVALVNGTNGHTVGQTGSNGQRVTTAAVKRGLAERPTRVLAPARGTSGEINPKTILPLEDDDFSDF